MLQVQTPGGQLSSLSVRPLPLCVFPSLALHPLRFGSGAAAKEARHRGRLFAESPGPAAVFVWRSDQPLQSLPAPVFRLAEAAPGRPPGLLAAPSRGEIQNLSGSVYANEG